MRRRGGAEYDRNDYAGFVGGMNSPVGAVFGSIVLIGAPELLRIVPQARILAYGVLLVVIIMFRSQGLFARKG